MHIPSRWLGSGSRFPSVRGALARQSTVRSRCCRRSLRDLPRELLLRNRHLADLPASQRTYWFHGPVCICSCNFFFFLLPPPALKAKSREPRGKCALQEWEAELPEQVTSADVGGSTTVPSTFFQGLAVPLRCIGCMQSPVYSEIPKSRFVCVCLLLQPVTGSVWYFFLLEFYRLGEGRV